MAKGGSGTMDGATVGEGDWGGRYVDPQFEGPSWFEARAGMDKSPAVDGSRRGGLGRALGGALVGGLLGGIPGAIAGGLRGGMSGGQRGPGRLPGGYLNLRDYFNGGGPGMAGTRFEGSPFAGLLNAIGVHPRGYAERQQTIADKLATRDYDVADPTRRGSYISAADAPSATGVMPVTEQYIPPQPVTASALSTQPVATVPSYVPAGMALEDYNTLIGLGYTPGQIANPSTAQLAMQNLLTSGRADLAGARSMIGGARRPDQPYYGNAPEYFPSSAANVAASNAAASNLADFELNAAANRAMNASIPYQPYYTPAQSMTAAQAAERARQIAAQTLYENATRIPPSMAAAAGAIVP